MKFKYKIGQIVYLKTDDRQLERIVTQIRITQHGYLYQLCEGVNESVHYEIEISEEKNVLITL
jgi:hypothetical protein